MDAKEFLKEYKQKAIPYIKDFIKKETETANTIGSIAVEMVSEFGYMADKGKGLRGFLMTVGYQIAQGQDLESIIKASTALEIYNTGILIHDDFMDRATSRRGVPTIDLAIKDKLNKYPKVDKDHISKSLAIDAGDFSFFLAFKILLESAFPLREKSKALEVFSNYSIRLTMGQSLDLVNPGDINATESDILNVMKIKTTEYTSLMPLLIGYYLGGGEDPKIVKTLTNYAECFGYAFQIYDDYLGIFGDENETGKSVLSDFAEGKNTMFVLYLKKHGNEKHIRFLDQRLGVADANREDVETFKRYLTETGTKDKVLKIAKEYVESGIKTLNGQPELPLEQRNILETILRFVVDRTA